MGKSHHYIPQFLLKRFSETEKLSCYRFDSGKCLENQPTKSLACENYFYGPGEVGEKIERHFCEIEGIAARILGDIDKAGALPHPNSPDGNSLAIFTVLQRARTRITASDYAATGNKMALDLFREHLMRDKQDETALEIQAKIAEDPSWFEKVIKFALPNAPLDCIQAALDAVPFLSDLPVEMVTTPKPLILSEAGVIAFNLFHSHHKMMGSGVGYGCKGICLFLPLDAHKAIIFFDDQTYRLQTKLIADDVDWLNEMSIMSSEKVVYWGNSIRYGDIARWLIKRQNMPSPQLFSKKKFVVDDVDEKEGYWTTQRVHRMSRMPSFLKLTKAAKLFEPHGRVMIRRNPELHRIRSDFLQLRENKKIPKTTSFWEYFDSRIQFDAFFRRQPPNFS